MTYFPGQDCNSSNPQPTSSNLSNLNQPENTSLIVDTSQEVSNACTSTPEHSVLSNPLVLSGTVPASLIESFIFLDINIKGKKPPRFTTKALLITSDEHMKAYNNKIQKIRLEQEAKENWRKEIERKRQEKEQQEKVKTHGGFNRRGLNTIGGKVNVGPAKIPRSTRNIRRPIRFIHDKDNEDVLSYESTDKEDWTCQECLNDDGIAADYVPCNTCERWFHKKCVKKSSN